jgi:enoyl-CoA hydratase
MSVPGLQMERLFGISVARFAQSCSLCLTGRSFLQVEVTLVADFICHACRDHSVGDSLDYVATWNSATLLSTDLKEAAQARLEKRLPVYSKL